MYFHTRTCGASVHVGAVARQPSCARRSLSNYYCAIQGVDKSCVSQGGCWLVNHMHYFGEQKTFTHILQFGALEKGLRGPRFNVMQSRTGAALGARAGQCRGRGRARASEYRRLVTFFVGRSAAGPQFDTCLLRPGEPVPQPSVRVGVDKQRDGKNESSCTFTSSSW